MPIPLYLAMTAAEMAACNQLPPHMGWMACHFSPSGPGLSNLPRELPSHSLLILDDSTPFSAHESTVITRQLQEVVSTLKCDALILDFQRPLQPDVQALVCALQQGLPCPVSAPPGYGTPDSPVFLSPCPPNQLLKDYLSPFRSREIFLEVALDGMKLSVTETGCMKESLLFWYEETFPHKEEKLHCHYRIEESNKAVEFILRRTRTDLSTLLKEAESFGVCQAIGLWQELKETT